MISVVIPSYNRRDSMLALLETVVAQTDVELEVIVVDDCSPDDTVAAIRARYPTVTVIENEQNGGPAVSRNRGIKAARGNIIVGFDSDVTVPDKMCLKKISEAFVEHPRAAGFAFRLLQPDGETDDYARWWHPIPAETNSTKFFETNYFSGTGYAFRTAELLRTNLYPEILYMHYEEVELAYRMIDNGGAIYYLPEVTVIHHEHQVSRRSEIKSFYKHRNQILLAFACYPVFRGVCFLIPRMTKAIMQAVFRRELANFFRILRSACRLSKMRMKERKPLHPDTWRRMAEMKRQVL